jgi:flagellar FliL protein
MAGAVAEDVKPGAKKRSLGKVLLLAINVLLFLAGGGFFLLTKFGLLPASPAPPPAAEQEPAKPGQAEPAPPAAPAPVKAATPLVVELVSVPLQPFVVNLSGDNGRRYLRVVIQLQVKGSKGKDDIEKNIGKIRDRLLFLLSGKTFEDISAVQGKYQLQQEIAQSINEALGTIVVDKAYFTEFVVQ